MSLRIALEIIDQNNLQQQEIMMKINKSYLLIVLFLCGLSAGNIFAADASAAAAAAGAGAPAAGYLGKELRDAIRRSSAMAKRLIAAGADVNDTAPGENTALSLAAIHRSSSLIKLILDKGAKINATTNYRRQTALMHAAASGDCDWSCGCGGKTEILLEAGADVDVQDENGNTALIFAAEKGHENAVKRLLLNGADKNIQNNRHQTAAELARAEAKKLQKVVLPRLVGTFAHIGPDCTIEQAKLNNWMIDNDIKKTQDKAEKLERIARYIERYEPPVQGRSIKFAGKRGENGLSVETVFTSAAAAAETYGAGVAADLGQKLIEAVKRGHIDQVQELLDTGTNVNATNMYGQTALIEAAFWGRAGIVKLLLDAKADVNAVNQSGYTALILAALYGHYDHADTVKLLVDAGADVNAVSPNSKVTALMIEANRGHENTVKLLLDAGADKAIQNKNGRTAEIYAREAGHHAIEQMIITHQEYQNALQRLQELDITCQEQEYQETLQHLQKLAITYKTEKK